MLTLSLTLDVGNDTLCDSTPGGSSNTYARPGGLSTYRRPGGTALYLRP